MPAPSRPSDAGATLTIDPNGTFTNTGTVRAGGGGGTVSIAPEGTGVAAGSPTWSNTGNLIVDTNGTLNLGGRVTTAGLNLPGVQRLGTGGVINLTGVIDASGSPLPR